LTINPSFLNKNLSLCLIYAYNHASPEGRSIDLRRPLIFVGPFEPDPVSTGVGTGNCPAVIRISFLNC